MTDALEMHAESTSPSTAAKPTLLGRFAAQYADITIPFEVAMPDGTVQRFGKGCADLPPDNQ